jgi:hypothetical protein
MNSSTCPLCGVNTPHEHTPLEQVIFNNGKKSAIAPTTPQEAISPAIAEGWISVNDRLPEEKYNAGGGSTYSDYCLIYNSELEVIIFRRLVDGLWAGYSTDDNTKVTHWMPLPSKPTGLE